MPSSLKDWLRKHQSAITALNIPGRRLNPSFYMGSVTTRTFWNGSHTGAHRTEDQTKISNQECMPMGWGFT